MAEGAVHREDAALAGGASGGCVEPPPEEGEEVERAIDRHAQRNRGGHHTANIERRAGPADQPKQEDHRKDVGHHRHQPRQHPPLHEHHDQCDQHAGGEKAGEQIVEQRLLDRIDQRHHAGVIGKHPPGSSPVALDDRIDAFPHPGEKLAKVCTGERCDPAGHPPELGFGEITHDAHVGQSREALLQLAGHDRFQGPATHAGEFGQVGEERGCGDDAGDAGHGGQLSPHLLHHFQPFGGPHCRVCGKPQHHFHRHQRPDRLFQPGIVVDHAAPRLKERVDPD